MAQLGLLHHLTVVLDDLLDDGILLVVEHPRVEVMLDLVQQDGVLLAWGRGGGVSVWDAVGIPEAHHCVC